MVLAWDMYGLNQREIGRQFGVGPYAVSKAIARATALAAQGGGSGRVIRRLNS